MLVRVIAVLLALDGLFVANLNRLLPTPPAVVMFGYVMIGAAAGILLQQWRVNARIIRATAVAGEVFPELGEPG